MGSALFWPYLRNFRYWIANNDKAAVLFLAKPQEVCNLTRALYSGVCQWKGGINRGWKIEGEKSQEKRWILSQKLASSTLKFASPTRRIQWTSSQISTWMNFRSDEHKRLSDDKMMPAKNFDACTRGSKSCILKLGPFSIFVSKTCRSTAVFWVKVI